MAAVAPTPEYVKPVVSDSFNHEEELKTHLARIQLSSAPFTTLAAFEYLTVLGAGIVGAIVLKVQTKTGPHYAILPLATGDETASIKNTGLTFVDAAPDWTKLDNKIVQFKIANGSSQTGPSSCVASFFTTAVDANKKETVTNIATLTFTNGQLTWLGSTGYCTFFPEPVAPNAV
ncbi:hypothetical protein CALVIDRAFT_560835 [Calocera viscosa TUFC12733]|uniref:Uncharacterized protein n=1 Tax=Calocera viscosa (strain TUFC12733) TaxID=1330018 RepID=A0A167QU55_CALVF|nr:hypothetical protein CALVIDRAFT_560835 [Calocera viscosa TUFC12733]